MGSSASTTAGRVASARAITGEAGSADLTVEETATTLSISGRQSGDGVRVSGRLRTAEGEGVAGQNVDLTVDGTTVASVTTDAAAPTSVDRSRRLLEAAQRYAEEHGDQEAVTAAYAAARRAVTSNLGVTTEGTHWEVYQQVRDRGSDELTERFRRLTESYEATQYGGILPGADRLEELLEDAGFVVRNTDDEG